MSEFQIWHNLFSISGLLTHTNLVNEKFAHCRFRPKPHSVDVDSLGIMNPLSWDNLSSDIRDKLTGSETMAGKPVPTANQPHLQGSGFIPGPGAAHHQPHLQGFGYQSGPGATINTVQLVSAENIKTEDGRWRFLPDFTESVSIRVAGFIFIRFFKSISNKDRQVCLQ